MGGRRDPRSSTEPAPKGYRAYTPFPLPPGKDELRWASSSSGLEEFHRAGSYSSGPLPWNEKCPTWEGWFRFLSSTSCATTRMRGAAGVTTISGCVT